MDRHNIWKRSATQAIDLSCRVREANVARIAILWTATGNRCAIDLSRRVRDERCWKCNPKLLSGARCTVDLSRRVLKANVDRNAIL